MYPRFMKPSAVAFAGGCTVLLACAAHDNTTFPNPPPPTETIPPIRTAVDAGLVIFSDDGGEGVSGGGAGASTPDAGEEPDVAPQPSLPDVGGPGTTCDVFASRKSCSDVLQCNPNCALKKQCNPTSDGTGTCQDMGSVFETGFCDPLNGLFCNSGLVCVGTVCTSLCHYPSPADCGGSVGYACKRWQSSETVGYCVVPS